MLQLPRTARQPAAARARNAQRRHSPGCQGPWRTGRCSSSRLVAVQAGKVDVVYKFGGSSVADAKRMCDVADIIGSFPDRQPCVVLSAMGKTTSTLLDAGAQAIIHGPESVPGLKPLRHVKGLHRDTCNELDIDADTVAAVERLLNELQQLLTGLSIMQELTPRAQDSLVSFGERLSTRIFSSLLRQRGINAQQFDAWNLGITTTDEFSNAEILYSASLPAAKQALATAVTGCDVPVVTGYLGRGLNTGAITTLGRGGSDLTATFLGVALGLDEVVVWKDVDGVLSSDPRIVRDARVVRELTFDEATELAYFGAQVLHPSAMYPAQISTHDIHIRVRNSYNLTAPGSLIRRQRNLAPEAEKPILTSLVLKPNVHLLDIVSTRMLGSVGFLARVFDIFRQEGISVDVVATSEVSVSVTLDCARLWSRDLIADELENLEGRFEGIANVGVQHGVSIISLICNAYRSSEILKKVFAVLDEMEIHVKMISQGASKTNISLIVSSDVAPSAIMALHAEFFGVSDECAASDAALQKQHT